MSTPHLTPCPSRRFAATTSTAILLTGLLTATGAHADLRWKWQYHSRSTVACGTLQTADRPDAAGYYRILSIAGQRDGVRISGLYPVGQAIPGNGNYRIDNLIKASGREKVTVHGFGFALASGGHANPFYLPGHGYTEVYTQGSNFSEQAVRFSARRQNAVSTASGKPVQPDGCR